MLKFSDPFLIHGSGSYGEATVRNESLKPNLLDVRKRLNKVILEPNILKDSENIS